MRYEPEPLAPSSIDPGLGTYVERELSRIAFALREVEGIRLAVLHVAPKRPRDGMVILVDGTDFNPGSGAGFYGRSAGAWVFLG